MSNAHTPTASELRNLLRKAAALRFRLSLKGGQLVSRTKAGQTLTWTYQEACQHVAELEFDGTTPAMVATACQTEHVDAPSTYTVADLADLLAFPWDELAAEEARIHRAHR